MEKGPFENVFSIEHGDIPLLCYFTRGYILLLLEEELSPYKLTEPILSTQDGVSFYLTPRPLSSFHIIAFHIISYC